MNINALIFCPRAHRRFGYNSARYPIVIQLKRKLLLQILGWGSLVCIWPLWSSPVRKPQHPRTHPETYRRSERPRFGRVQGTATMEYSQGISRRSDAAAGQRWAFPSGQGSFGQLQRCSSLTCLSGTPHSSCLGPGQNSPGQIDGRFRDEF